MWPFKKKEPEIIITRAELISLLPDAQYIQVSDRSYVLPTVEEILKALGVDSSEYVPERNDCDDYASRAWGKVSRQRMGFWCGMDKWHTLNQPIY